MRRGGGLAAAVLAAVFLSGCRSDRVVRIGVAAPLTGEQAKVGADLAQAVELAVAEENEKGPILPGYRVEVVRGDDQSNPTEAVTVAKKLVSDPAVVAVIGHYNSSSTQPASAVYHEAHVLEITPASTNPALSHQGFDTFFRTCATDDVQGRRAAEYAVGTLRKKRLCVLDDKTTYGVGLADQFERRAKELGAACLREHVAQDDKDFSALLTKVKASGPELVFLCMIYPDAALIVNQARRMGMRSILMGGDGTFDASLIQLAGPAAAEGYLATMEGGQIESLESARAFVAAYQKRYGPVGPFSAYAYDAAKIAVTALREAGKPDRVAVLASVTITRRYSGATGEIVFDENGDNAHQIFSVYRVHDGQFGYAEEAKPLESTTSPAFR